MTDTDPLDEVTGRGPVREPDDDAQAEAAALDADAQPDMRGDRDHDETAPNPWRAP